MIESVLRLLHLWSLVVVVTSNGQFCANLTSCLQCTSLEVDNDFNSTTACNWCPSRQLCQLSSSHDNLCPVVETRTYQTINCPLQPFMTYSDANARRLYTLWSAMFAMDAIGCVNSIDSDTIVDKQYLLHCSHERQGLCAAVIAISKRRHEIYLAFREMQTNSVNSLAFSLLLESFRAYKPFGNNGRVMRYVHNGFHRLWHEAGIGRDLRKLFVDQQISTFTLWPFVSTLPIYLLLALNDRLQIIGHSLGGSLAELTALYTAKRHYWSSQSIRLLTFGQPRTGDVVFSQSIERYLPYHYRVVHRNDVITSLPWRTIADANGRTPITSPYHHRYEVWYNNDMSLGSEYRICQLAEDPTCSNSQPLTWNIVDHNNYFNVTGEHFTDIRCAISMPKIISDNDHDGSANNETIG